MKRYLINSAHVKNKILVSNKERHYESCATKMNTKQELKD